MRYIFYALIMAVMFAFSRKNLINIKQDEQPDSLHSLLRIQLGRSLFYDKSLSLNRTKSCASCHAPQFAFTDGYRRSITAFGSHTAHNAPSLINASEKICYNWGDSSLQTIDAQSAGPLFGRHPDELGWGGREAQLLRRIHQNPAYELAFAMAFPGIRTPSVSVSNLQASLAAFVGILKSRNSRYDAFIAGNRQALTGGEKAGMALFFSARLQCAACHPPPMFTVNNRTRTKPGDIYFNLGLYRKYPTTDTGIGGGRFAVPSLRNVALTAPYYHDGSAASLSGIIDNYARGGRLVSGGPDAGDGALNPAKDRRIKGFTVSPAEKAALIDFLCALTDTTVIYRREWGPVYSIR